MGNLLATLSRSPSRSLELEKNLVDYVNDYLAVTVPEELKALRSILDTTADRCKVIMHERLTVFDELQHLRSELGLERPWLWWRRRTWERSAVVQERKRLISSTVESFDLIESLLAAVEKSQTSLGRYMEAGVFETVETYSLYDNHRSSKISVDQYLVSRRILLDDK